MKLSKDQVKHVAKLANLPLSEKEEETYSEQLSAVLEYIEKLNEVETSGINPTYNVSGNSNVLAADATEECLDQEAALANTPNTKDGFFVTKGVFGEE